MAIIKYCDLTNFHGFIIRLNIKNVSRLYLVAAIVWDFQLCGRSLGPGQIVWVNPSGFAASAALVEHMLRPL